MSNETNQQAAIEQKINEMVQQSRILEAYMNETITRQATVTRLIEEAHLSSSAIQSITGESEVESLVPVGIGVYIRASLPPVKKLLVNVGAGVTMEKSREDTINYIESRIKEFEIALRQLANQKQQIEMRMEQIQGQVNQMLQQTRTTAKSPPQAHGRNTGQPQSLG
jgi:prefoldin alpha subunit